MRHEHPRRRPSRRHRLVVDTAGCRPTVWTAPPSPATAVGAAKRGTMPTYDYRCADCESTFEVFQRISAKAEATCPSCGSTTPKRLISGGTFHLKGSGWYASDYQGSGRTGTHAGRESTASQAEGAPAAAAVASEPAAGASTGSSSAGSSSTGSSSAGSSSTGSSSAGSPSTSSGE